MGFGPSGHLASKLTSKLVNVVESYDSKERVDIVTLVNYLHSQQNGKWFNVTVASHVGLLSNGK